MSTTEPEGRLRSAEHRVATAMNRRLVDQISRDGRRRFTADRIAVLLLCTPVHLVTLAFIATGALLIGLGSTWPERVLGVVSLLIAFGLAGPDRLLLTTRARRESRQWRQPGLMAAEHPATRALVIRIAALVGSPVPDRVGVMSEINAYATVRRGRRVLGYGAPLWLAEGREGRLATLGHELGHFAHGDILAGRYAGTALRSLYRWVRILETGHDTGYGGVLSVLDWPVRAVLTGYIRLIELAAGPSNRRQEHYADLASAVVAGTDAAVASLEILLAAEHGLDVATNRAAIRREDLTTAIAEFRSGFDAERRAAVRRIGDIEKSRVDDSHPPTMERIRLLESGEHLEAAITLTQEEWDAIEAEWAPALTRQLSNLAERHRYVR
jgi:heat shock protein HtpX